MTRAAALALAGLGLGFLAGFLWGQGTSSALSGATSTDYAGGVLTVRVRVGQALAEGARAIFGQ